MREDWTECLLGDISSKITKGSTPTTYGYKYQNEGINFIKIENVVKGRIDLKSIHQFISEEAHNSQKRSQLIEGDVLFSIAGTIGETCLISEDVLPANTNQAFAIINGFNKVLLADFLRKQLDSFVSRKLKAKARGGAMNNVSLTDLKELSVVIPPLVEQKAIVKKIEELFSSLDSGIADLTKAQDQLKIYRQAVLKKAFEREYEIKKLGEVAEVKRGKSKHRPRNDKSLFGGKYPFIQTGEIRATNGGIIKEFTKTYSEKGLAQSKLWPKGTLCLTIAANIGETAFLGFDACFPDSVVGIKPNDELLNSKYLNFYVQKIKEEMESKASATAQKNINVRILEVLEIPLPSLKEQHQIVQEIESRLSVCDKVEKDLADSLEKAQALRQSILKKAFEGKLLSKEEIEACKRQPNYEAASVLLERIKKEKRFS